jgi:hypothetical protein
MIMVDFSELADLIDAFAGANEAFKAQHRADYNSRACAESYQRKEDAFAGLLLTLTDALEGYPRELAAALRFGSAAKRP